MKQALKDLIDLCVKETGMGWRKHCWQGNDWRESAIVSGHVEALRMYIEKATMHEVVQVALSMERMIAFPGEIAFEEYMSTWTLLDGNKRFLDAVNRYDIIAYVVEGGSEGIYLHVDEWNWRDSKERKSIITGKTLNERWRTELWQVAGRIQFLLSRA